MYWKYQKGKRSRKSEKKKSWKLPKFDEKQSNLSSMDSKQNEHKAKSSWPRHITVKMLKDKEKTLKEQEKNHIKGDPKGLTIDSSSETMGTGRQWDSIFQVVGRNTVKQELDSRDLLPWWPSGWEFALPCEGLGFWSLVKELRSHIAAGQLCLVLQLLSPCFYN